MGLMADIAKASNLPLLIYYFPMVTGKTLTIDEMLRLLDIPGIIGLKLTDWNLLFVKRILIACPHTIIFNGFDELLLPGLMYGAVGGIGTFYNLFPKLFVDIYHNFKQGDIAKAMQFQELLLEFSDLARKIGILPIFQYLMQKRRNIEKCFREPSPKIDIKCLQSIESLLERSIENIDHVTKV